MLNPNNRSHYRVKNNAKNTLIEAVADATHLACGDMGAEWVAKAGFPWVGVSIAVVWRYFYGVQPDADNCLAMLKSAFDAMVRAGVLGDDRKVIHLPMVLIKAKNKDAAGFTMTLRVLDDSVCPLCLTKTEAAFTNVEA